MGFDCFRNQGRCESANSAAKFRGHAGSGRSCQLSRASAFENNNLWASVSHFRVHRYWRFMGGVGNESSRQPDKIAAKLGNRGLFKGFFYVNRGWNMGCSEKSYYLEDNLCTPRDARRRRRRFIWRVKCVSLTDTQLCGCSDGRAGKPMPRPRRRSRPTWPLSFLSENVKGEEASKR